MHRHRPGAQNSHPTMSLAAERSVDLVRTMANAVTPVPKQYYHAEDDGQKGQTRFFVECFRHRHDGRVGNGGGGADDGRVTVAVRAAVTSREPWPYVSSRREGRHRSGAMDVRASPLGGRPMRAPCRTNAAAPETTAAASLVPDCGGCSLPTFRDNTGISAPGDTRSRHFPRYENDGTLPLRSMRRPREPEGRTPRTGFKAHHSAGSPRLDARLAQP